MWIEVTFKPLGFLKVFSINFSGHGIGVFQLVQRVLNFSF